MELLTIIIFLLGLCFGSFANVIIFRLPAGVSIVKPRSHCMSCKKQLGVIELLPVISYFLLMGKCRHCKEKFSIRYPMTELLCGLLFVAALWINQDLSVLFHAVLAFVLLTVALIDWDTQTIPDGLVIAGAIVGVSYVAAGYLLPLLPDYEMLTLLFESEMPISAPAWQNALLGAVVGALPLFVIDRLTLLLVKKDGFGFGDVKLMGMAGLFLGWQMVLAAFFFAFIAGGFFAFVLILTRRAGRGSYMPFAPFLAVGVLGSLWYGDYFIAWFGQNLMLGGF